jgi:hypothetical protein
VLNRWQGAESGCPVHITCGLDLNCWTNSQTIGLVLGGWRCTTTASSKRQEINLDHCIPTPQKITNRQDKTERSFNRWHSTRYQNQPRTHTTEPSRTCQSGPNTPQGLRLTQTMEQGVFLLVAPWHGGFHEGVDWLSAVPHAPRREPGSISGEKAFVSSTDVPEYPREDNGEFVAFGYALTGKLGIMHAIIDCLHVFEDRRRLVDSYA